MEIDEKFYQNFLEELNELEKFRMSYTSLINSFNILNILEKKDPDMRRLIKKGIKD